MSVIPKRVRYGNCVKQLHKIFRLIRAAEHYLAFCFTEIHSYQELLQCPLSLDFEFQRRFSNQAMCKETHFLLCGSCFWCASFLELRVMIDVCPLCMYGKVESMPLSDKEIYTFDYDLTSGVTLSFSSNR